MAQSNDRPVDLNFRSEGENEVVVLHGDDQSELMRLTAERDTRRVLVEVAKDSPRVVVTNMVGNIEAEFDHDVPDSSLGIERRWKIADRDDEHSYFVCWKEDGGEIALRRAPEPGPLTPLAVPEVYGQDDLLFRVAMAFKLGTHVLLNGPTGTGKTTMIEWLASILNYNYVLMPITRDTDAAAMVGEYMPGDEHGRFPWVDGPVTQAVRLSQQHPTILLLDEANRIGNVAHYSRIYSLIDRSRKLLLPEKTDENKVAEIIPAGKLYVAATSNPSDAEDGTAGAADYIGVQELDPALADRFGYHPPVGYPPKEIEIRALMDRVHGLGIAQASLIVDAANRVRNADEVRVPMSFRQMIHWAEALPYEGYAGGAEVAVVQKAPALYRVDLRNLLGLQRSGDKED